MLLQQAWNMRECVRLLTPGVSERQFKPNVDRRWTDEANASLDEMFQDVGLKLKRARQLFAPDDCPDLIVPHVVWETEDSRKDRKRLVHRERADIFDDYTGPDKP